MAPLPTPHPLALDQRLYPGYGREGGHVPVDPATVAAITDLYREVMPPGGAILDVMSSWVSHLPPEEHYRRVVGLGIDPHALAENAFLDEWRVQDLNQEPVLPFSNNEFDGAAFCGAVQYLTRPGEVIRELGRVLTSRRAAGGDILEPLFMHDRDRVLAAVRRYRPALAGRALFCRGG